MTKGFKINWVYVILALIIGAFAGQAIWGLKPTTNAEVLGNDLCYTELGSGYKFNKWIGVAAFQEVCWTVQCIHETTGNIETICVQLDGHAEC